MNPHQSFPKHRVHSPTQYCQRSLICLDLEAGEPLWNEKDPDRGRVKEGSVAQADGRVYYHTEDGEVILIEPSRLDYAGRGRLQRDSQLGNRLNRGAPRSISMKLEHREAELFKPRISDGHGSKMSKALQLRLHQNML